MPKKKKRIKVLSLDDISIKDLSKIEIEDLEIAKETLKILTIGDLFNNARLAYIIEKKYPRVYLNLTKPVREIKIAQFLYHAQAQENAVKEMANLAPYTEKPPKNLKHGIKVIKDNGLGTETEIWLGGVPFKFELSRFVSHYAKERTYKEWRAILKDIGATKGNMERILELYGSKFKH
mgnify:FL=1